MATTPIGQLIQTTLVGYLGATDAITATGTVQANAYAITTTINNVTTTAAGTGVRLPTVASPGLPYIIRNGGANPLNVYPQVNGTINAGAANIAYSLPTGGLIQFVAVNSTAWFTMAATYA